MVTDISNDAGSGQRLVGLLQQSAPIKSNPLIGARGGPGRGRASISVNNASQLEVNENSVQSPTLNINISPPNTIQNEANSNNFVQIMKAFEGEDSTKATLKTSSADKNIDIMKQAVAKSNPLTGGRGSILLASPVKPNMDELIKNSIQAAESPASGGGGPPRVDSANKESFGEIKRRFEEAAAINSSNVASLTRGASVSIISTSPSTVASSPSSSFAARGSILSRSSSGIMQQSVARSNPLVGGRVGAPATAAGRGRGGAGIGSGFAGASLSSSSGEGGTGLAASNSIRLENFEEIKQKFESAASAVGAGAAAILGAPRARRSSATDGGTGLLSPHGKWTAEGENSSSMPGSPVPAASLLLSQPDPLTVAATGGLMTPPTSASSGRPLPLPLPLPPQLLQTRSFDAGMPVDRAQAPVMLQAVARANPLGSGGRGSGVGGRGGRSALASASQERAAASASVAIGRVPLNWQSNVSPPAVHVSSAPIVVGESFVEKKRNYEKSLAQHIASASQSQAHTPSSSSSAAAAASAVQQQQQQQQLLQQFMIRTDPLKTPPLVGPGPGPSPAPSSTTPSTADRHSQMMQVAVAKSNPLVGGRSAVVAGRGKGAQGSAERGRAGLGSVGVGRGSGGKSPSSSPLRGNSPEPGGISRRPIVRANSSDQANLRPLLPLGQSQGQGPPTLLSPATASLSSPLQVAGLTGAGLGAALPTNTAAAIATGALPSSLGTPIETPSVISRTNSELQMGVVPDRQLEIMQQAVSKSNPLSGGGRGAGGRGRGASGGRPSPAGPPVGPVSTSAHSLSVSPSSPASASAAATPFTPATPISSLQLSIELEGQQISGGTAGTGIGASKNPVLTPFPPRSGGSSSSSQHPPSNSHSHSSHGQGQGHSLSSGIALSISSEVMDDMLPATISGGNSSSSGPSSVPTNHSTADSASALSSSPAVEQEASVYSTISLSGPTEKPKTADIGAIDAEYSGGHGHFASSGFAHQSREGISPSLTTAGAAVGSRQMEIMQQAVNRSNPLGGRGRRRSSVKGDENS